MKKLHCVLMFLSVGVGLSVGLSVRPVQVFVFQDQQKGGRKFTTTFDDGCTCVPCLPDYYCRKCGHKSRDCPKLRAYFSKTNSLTVAVSTNLTQKGGRRD